jgi:ABC-type nickel/cobalt efflux system permease component RcnA
MSTVTVTGLCLGVLLGMRHALEPDHIAAVSTLVLESGSSRRGMWLGAFWGIGHSLSLLVVGCLLAILHAELPSWLGEVFELAVAVMLVMLGLRAFRQATRAPASHAHDHGHTHAHDGHGHTHTHDGHDHAPAHDHAGFHLQLHAAHRATLPLRRRRSLASRPLLFGVIHGLAGSGALTALVVAELPSTAARVTYIVLFGLGSIVGMASLSGLAGWPIARLGRRRVAAVAISLLTGSLSFGLGLVLMWPFGLRALHSLAR